MGKFRQVFMELPARDTIMAGYYSFNVFNFLSGRRSSSLSKRNQQQIPTQPPIPGPAPVGVSSSTSGGIAKPPFGAMSGQESDNTSAGGASKSQTDEATQSTGLSKYFIIIFQIRRGIHIIIFLFQHDNIGCGYSLEAPQQGTSNEQHNVCFQSCLLLFLDGNMKHPSV